jgi:predicted nucleic acid-binding protein
MSEDSPVRATVDTNVFISGSIIKRGNPYLVLEAWRNRLFLLVSSPALLPRSLKY